MAWLKYRDNSGNSFLWSDFTQSMMEKKLRRVGFSKNGWSSSKQKKLIYDLVSRDDELKGLFTEVWRDNHRRNLRFGEFGLHICIGLGHPDISECNFYNKIENTEDTKSGCFMNDGKYVCSLDEECGICDEVLKNKTLFDNMNKMITKMEETGLEYGGNIIKSGNNYRLEHVCEGDECSVNIPDSKILTSTHSARGSGNIGTFHTHPNAGTGLSEADIRSTMRVRSGRFDESVDCIGASDKEIVKKLYKHITPHKTNDKRTMVCWTLNMNKITDSSVDDVKREQTAFYQKLKIDESVKQTEDYRLDCGDYKYGKWCQIRYPQER